MAECESNFCEVCLKLGESVSASVFCYDCSEKLCQNCVAQHKKFKSMTGHKLVDMTGDPGNLEAVKMARDLQKCPKHPMKDVEYICKEHDQVCCTECVIVSHRKCSNLASLTDECSNRNTSECKISTMIEALQEQTKSVLDVEKKKQETIEQSKELIRKKLAIVKLDLDAAYTALKQTVLANVDKASTSIIEESQKNMSDEQQICDKMTSVRCKADMIAGQKNPVLSYLFDYYQRQQIGTIRGIVSKIVDTTRHKDVNISESDSVKTLCHLISGCLKVEVVTSKPTFHFDPPMASEASSDLREFTHRQAKLEYVESFDTGYNLCLWLGKYIILFFYGIGPVLLFDVTNRKVVDEMTNFTKISSAVCIADNQVAYCNATRSIKILTVQHDTITLIQNLRTDCVISRMSFNSIDNQLVCLSEDAVSVRFITLDGQTVHTILLTERQKILIKGARSIVYDVQRLRICVSNKNYVFSIDKNGQNYVTLSMKCPWGMTADCNGNVYIVDTMEGSITKMLPQGNRRTIMLPNATMLQPLCMTFSKSMTKFAVLCIGGTLKVFSFI